MPEATLEALATAIDLGLPYVGLRNVAVDPTLIHYIPLSVAHEHWIVPVLIADDALTVASADPDPDLSAVARRFPNLSIEVVLAAQAEIAELLARLEAATSATRVRRHAGPVA